MEDGYWNAKLNDASIARRDVDATVADLIMTGDLFKDYMVLCDRLRIMPHPELRQQQVESEQRQEERKDKGQDDEEELDEYTEITIRGMEVDMGTLTALARAMPTASMLTSISFWKTALGLDHLSLLADAVANSEVRTLRIEWNEIPKSRAASVSAEATMLIDSGSMEGGSKMDDVKESTGGDDDTKTETGLGAAAAAAASAPCTPIAAFIDEHSPLEALWLRGNGIDEAGATTLAQRLRGNKNITELNITHNSCGDVGARAFGDTFYLNRKLRRIAFGSNGCTVEGANAMLMPLISNEVPERILEEVKMLIEADKDYLKHLKKSNHGSKAKGNKKKKTSRPGDHHDVPGTLDGPLEQDPDSSLWSMPCNSCVKELDLSGNDFGSSGLRDFTERLAKGASKLTWLGVRHVRADKVTRNDSADRLREACVDLTFVA